MRRFRNFLYIYISSNIIYVYIVLSYWTIHTVHPTNSPPTWVDWQKIPKLDRSLIVAFVAYSCFSTHWCKHCRSGQPCKLPASTVWQMISWESVLGGHAGKACVFCTASKSFVRHIDMVHAFTFRIVGVFLCVTPRKLLIFLDVAGWIDYLSFEQS